MASNPTKHPLKVLAHSGQDAVRQRVLLVKYAGFPCFVRSSSPGGFDQQHTCRDVPFILGPKTKRRIRAPRRASSRSDSRAAEDGRALEP